AGDRFELGFFLIRDLQLARVLLQLLDVVLELVDAALVFFRRQFVGRLRRDARWSRGHGDQDRDSRRERGGKPVHVSLLHESCRLRFSGQQRALCPSRASRCRVGGERRTPSWPPPFAELLTGEVFTRSSPVAISGHGGG